MFHVPVQLGIQAVATHQEVGIATAMFLTFTSLGGSVGSAVAGAIWTGLLPEKLQEYLPNIPPDERKRIFDDFKFAMSFPRESPEREGIVLAYVDVMKRLTRTATLAAVPMIVFVLVMKEVKLDGSRRRSLSLGSAVDDEVESPGRTLRPRLSSPAREPAKVTRQESS